MSDTNPNNPAPNQNPQPAQPTQQPVETIPHVITPDPEMVAKAQASEKPSSKGTLTLAIIALIIVVIAVVVSLDQRNTKSTQDEDSMVQVDQIAVDPDNRRDFAEIETFVQGREAPLSDSHDIDDVVTDLEATEFHSINTDLIDLDAAR